MRIGDLSGRTALVTGAASGIGAATRTALLEAGAWVIGLDRVALAADAEDWGRADVSEETEVIAAVAEAAARLGSIDILVNSAGIDRATPIRSFDAAIFDRLCAVNLRGTALVTREALRHMPTGGRIVNLASELAFLGRAGSSAYCATKGGILSMTRSWARELAPDILVNAVAPGPTDTPLLDWQGMSPALRALELANPLGRIGRPEEIAQAVLFLAGPGAGFITGQCIGVDGGAAMR